MPLQAPLQRRAKEEGRARVIAANNIVRVGDELPPTATEEARAAVEPLIAAA